MLRMLAFWHAGTPRPNAVVVFLKVRRKPNFTRVGIEYACGQLYTCIQRSPVEFQTPTHTGA
jgi:hypothetical protein